MTPLGDPDPLERSIEQALRPGAFIADGACASFVNDLSGVAAQLRRLRRADAARAVALHETFLAGCYEKAEELDDSSGRFGQFIADLYLGWIRSAQAAGVDPDRLVDEMLARVERDPYGFAGDVPQRAASAMRGHTLRAFERHARAQFELATQAGTADAAAAADTPGTPGAPGTCGADDAHRLRWAGVLRSIYLAQKRVRAYSELAQQMGLTAEDCHAIATLLAARRKPAQALDWVERGIELEAQGRYGSHAGFSLPTLRRRLLVQLGRVSEALDLAWTAFRRFPSTHSYDDLIALAPETDRATWHHRAVEALEAAHLDDALDLLVHAKEQERLAEVVRRAPDAALEGLSHYSAEPAAESLEGKFPELAARLWRAQGLRIVNGKKSRYYGAALADFGRAKACFQRAGLAAEWDKIVQQVRVAHHRKVGFISEFEDIVAGTSDGRRPTFLERAKAKWAAMMGGSASSGRAGGVTAASGHVATEAPRLREHFELEDD